jgi:hypothetical protein
MLFYKKNYSAFTTLVLRLMLGVLTFLKLLIWMFLWLIPGKRERAAYEIASNREVIALCWQLK